MDRATGVEVEAAPHGLQRVDDPSRGRSWRLFPTHAPSEAAPRTVRVRWL